MHVYAKNQGFGVNFIYHNNATVQLKQPTAPIIRAKKLNKSLMLKTIHLN